MNTRGELGHSVVACARTTGHDCVRTTPVRPSPAEWLLSKEGSNLRSSALFMAWKYPRCYFKPVCDYQPVCRPFRGRLSGTVSWPQLVTIVPVPQRQRSQLCPATVTIVPVLQTRKITTLWGLYLYICYLTDTEMLVKKITLYCDPKHMNNGYTYTRQVYLNWNKT